MGRWGSHKKGKKNMSKLLSGLLAVAVALVSAIPGGIGVAAVTSTISGTVTTVYQDRPVENARITAKDPQGNILAIADSDSEGKYSIVLPVGVAYELELDPPGIYTQKSPTETPKGVMTANGEMVDWKVSFEGAFWFFAGGVGTGVAVPLGITISDRDKDEVRTGSR